MLLDIPHSSFFFVFVRYANGLLVIVPIQFFFDFIDISIEYEGASISL